MTALNAVVGAALPFASKFRQEQFVFGAAKLVRLAAEELSELAAEVDPSVH